MKNIYLTILARFGLSVTPDPKLPDEHLGTFFRQLWRKTHRYTMTTTERMYALYNATEYISRARVYGDVVECGVWRGGSAMVCAYTLKSLHDTHRKLYLYDTYSGMARPGKLDRTVLGNTPAYDIWQRSQRGGSNAWCYAPLAEVQKNLRRTGYPLRNLIFIAGKVEDTIPKLQPKHIALLRLDTDWYASTYHELVHLYPRLVRGGVLIIDDYGHWKGSRLAVDTYFRQHKVKMLLTRIDYSGRLGVKP